MPKGRATRYIRRKPASNLYHAIRIAERLGHTFSHFVTINFTLIECPDDEVSQAFRWLRARWADWMRRPSRRGQHQPCKPADAWTIEAKGGVLAAHWLIHLPEGRIEDCKARLDVWISQLAGGTFPDNTVRVDVIYSARGLGRYVLKAIDPVYAAKYGVQPEDQGVVIDKRSGFSQRLGPTVKKQMRDAGTYPRVRPWARYSEQQVRGQFPA